MSAAFGWSVRGDDGAVACPLGWSALCHGVMGAGMAIALLAMA